jgi:Na+-transporting methylmalonyl-CoA/oxaloacetate decarboxylase gamma subunit
MDTFTFGWTMTVLGIGVTLLTLVILGLVIQFMNKLFPDKEEVKKE